MGNPQFHIAVIGFKAVGKSNYLRRFYTGEYNKRNVPLPNHTIEDLYNTSIGKVNIKMTEYHDVSDVPNTVHGVIIMFDTTNIASFTIVPEYIQIMSKITNNIVVCGNKVDDKNRTVKWRHITKQAFTKYYDVSCRSNYHFGVPIEYLISSHLNADFVLVEQDAIDPPEFTAAEMTAAWAEMRALGEM
jgi:GTPase SAR1 family protein